MTTTAVPLAADPLADIVQLLPGRKGALASRRIHAGLSVDGDAFAARGLGLAAGEVERLGAWVKRDLSTAVSSSRCADDGTDRLVLRCTDGAIVETVAMRRGTVCVSTQVGCAVGCVFCASGMAGLGRNLTAGEIVEQAVHARRRMTINRVVFMGMGEPSANAAAVLEAVSRFKHDAGIGPARQMVSTVGSLEFIDRLHRAAVRPGLALSLHTSRDELRRRLLPRAPSTPVAELIAAVDDYARSTKLPSQYEWTLLAGVNDDEDDVREAARLLRGRFGCLNFIVWNPVEGARFSRPDDDRVRDLVALAREQGIHTTVRHSSGSDADAACGQLRRRADGSADRSGSP